MAERETGTVVKWNEKGFGFIERDGIGDRIFVHARDTVNRQAPVPGSKVSFIYEPDEKGGKAREVAVEKMAEVVAWNEGPREMGKVMRWNADKGFGFIERANGEANTFFHKKSFGGYCEPYVGQVVSFVCEEGPKGPAAVRVNEEEGGTAVDGAPVENERDRETGTVKRWNAEKGFGFIGRVNGEDDAFFHKRSVDGSNEPYVGQAVSFVFREGPKGAAAIKVKEEGGGATEVVEEEGERETGKVKTWNQEKGFAFIDVEPYVGQSVSFLYEITEKGGTAKKIREEDSVPDIPLSDEGRCFGTIKNFNKEKGFGSIVARKDGEEVRFFDKALNEVKPEKYTCVSFVLEEGDKGPLAKDLRKEDQNRVARVTARVHYGQVVIYKDPPPSKPDSGFGFIVEHDQLHLERPKRHYFHMWEIKTPDDEGGIDPGATVSFIIIPARKGFQAAAVTITDVPKNEEAKQENDAPLEKAMEEMGVNEDKEATTDATNGDWGSGGW